MIEGVLEIFRATSAKRKYFALLTSLARIGVLELPEEMHSIVQRSDLTGIVEASRKAVVTCPAASCEILYIQPNGGGPGVVDFDEFSRVVRMYPDALSQRFAASLDEWSRVEPGSPR